MFLPFAVRTNCSSVLKIFANSWPSASNLKSFSWSLEQFFLTVGQNNFGNKIPLISKFIYNKSKCQKYEWMINNTNVPFKATEVMIRFRIVNTEPWFCFKDCSDPFTVQINCSTDLKNVANLRLKAEYFQKYFSITTTTFSHSRSEPFSKENIRYST